MESTTQHVLKVKCACVCVVVKLTEQHEEQRTDQCGHDDQQREPDTLPHLSRTPDSSSGIKRGDGGLCVCVYISFNKNNNNNNTAWQLS